MAKRIVTIAGIKYELDTEDPSYKRRLTPEFTTKEAIKQSIGRAENFLKYLTPGLSTVAFAKDADASAHKAYNHFKNKEYRQGAADVAHTVGNLFFGAASLSPFVSAVLKPTPTKLTAPPAGATKAVSTTPKAPAATTSTATAKSADELVDLARAGNVEAQQQLTQYGINWEQKPLHRFVSERELNRLLYDEALIPGRTSAGVDVTTNSMPSTGVSMDYRVTFKPVHDFSKTGAGGNRAILKNAQLGDGYLRGGYTLEDVAEIWEYNPATGQYRLYWQPEFKNGGTLNYFDYFK